MRFARYVITLLLFGIGAFTLGYLYLLSLGQTEPPVEESWELEGAASVPSGAVTVRFTGTSTLLFDDGDTKWMVDGWFSRPGILDYLIGGVTPDVDAIKQGLQANEVTELAAVIPMHSHYDHAMDSPEVARLTGAKLMGSESTANIGRGWGLPEEQIVVLENEAPFALGQFTITPIEIEHYVFPGAAQNAYVQGAPRIEEPLVPPVALVDYKLGKTYALSVEHPKGRFVVVASAGYLPQALDGFDTDVLFLGIGGLGAQTQAYRDAFWQETVVATSPQKIIPIHYDSLTAPIDGPFSGPGPVLKMLGVGGSEQTLSFLQSKAQENPKLEFATLPRYDEVILFR